MKWFKGLSRDWRMFIYGCMFGILYGFGKILIGFEPANFIINFVILFFLCLVTSPFIMMFDDKYIAQKENDII